MQFIYLYNKTKNNFIKWITIVEKYIKLQTSRGRRVDNRTLHLLAPEYVFKAVVYGMALQGINHGQLQHGGKL